MLGVHRVLLSTLLEDCGIDMRKAKYLLVEGADGSAQSRTISLERALDDCMVAYGMNGEMIRPENGYPLRFVAPGLQGVSWVKWLRRIEVGDMRWSQKDETTGYADVMPDGTMRRTARFGSKIRDHLAVRWPGCWTRDITTLLALPGRVAEKSSASMCQWMVVSIGALRVWKHPFSVKR